MYVRAYSLVGRVLVFSCLVWLFCFRLLFPAVADSGPMSVVPSVAKPEGIIAPSFLTKAHASIPGSGSPAYLQTGFEVDYLYTRQDGTDYQYMVFSNSGSMSYNPSETAYTTDIDLGTPTSDDSSNYHTFGPSAKVVIHEGASGSVYTYTGSGPYTIGIVLVNVVNEAGAPVHNATVTMFRDNDHSTYTSFLTASGSCSFGQGLYVQADCPYPPGPAYAFYRVQASAPGYASSDAVFFHGNHVSGSTFKLVLSPNGYGESTQVATPAASNPDVPPPPAPVATGTPQSILDFITNFWETFKSVLRSLFVPDPASLAKIKSAGAEIGSYGPFGLPAQIASLLGSLSVNAQNNILGSQANGTYWYWYFNADLFIPAFTSGAGFGYPAGYDPSKEIALAHPHTMYDTMLPQYVDLTPFSDVLLAVRRYLLVFGWLTFLVNLLGFLTPKPQV